MNGILEQHIILAKNEGDFYCKEFIKIEIDLTCRFLLTYYLYIVTMVKRLHLSLYTYIVEADKYM